LAEIIEFPAGYYKIMNFEAAFAPSPNFLSNLILLRHFLTTVA